MFGWCGGTLVKKQMKKDAKLAAVLRKGQCNVVITLGSEGGMEFTRPCVVAGRVCWVLSGCVLSDLTINVQFPKGMDLGDDAVYASCGGDGGYRITYAVACTVGDMLKFIYYVNEKKYLDLVTTKNRLRAVTFGVSGGQGDMPVFTNGNRFAATVDENSSVIPAGVVISAEIIVLLRRLDLLLA
jgi:hypothetical protein